MTEKEKSGFVPGDIVKVKGQPQIMTVEHVTTVSNRFNVKCVWFCEQDRIFAKDVFLSGCLEKVPSE